MVLFPIHTFSNWLIVISFGQIHIIALLFRIWLISFIEILPKYNKNVNQQNWQTFHSNKPSILVKKNRHTVCHMTYYICYNGTLKSFIQMKIHFIIIIIIVNAISIMVIECKACCRCKAFSTPNNSTSFHFILAPKAQYTQSFSVYLLKSSPTRHQHD